MNSGAAITRSKLREWPSYNGRSTPTRGDGYAVGDEFVRALHHRLCQPLTALSCALEIMQMGREQDARLMEQIQAALVQSERISEMMGMFRQMFEAGASVCEHHAVSLDEVVEEVVEDMAPLADLQHVHIRLERAERGAAVDMAQRALRQGLWGVVQNCVEVTPAKGGITISRRGQLLIICDSSRSSGTEIDNCFDPFSYTTNKSNNTHVSNLPLALAQSLMAASGGELTVAASPQGRSFTFKFIPAQMKNS